MKLVPFSAVLSLLVAALVAACTKDSYDQGTGELSLVQADFVELPTNSEGYATTAVTATPTSSPLPYTKAIPRG